MLYDFKISTRLIGSIIILLCFIIVIGLCGKLGMSKMQGYLNHVASSDAKLVEYAQRSRANINALRRFEKDVLLNLDDRAKLEQYKLKWDEYRDRFNNRIDAVEKLTDSAKDKELISEVKNNMAVYGSGFNSLYSQIQSGTVKTPQDANKAVEQYKKSAHQAEKMVTDFAATMDQRMNGTVKEANDGSNIVQLVMVGLATVAVILSLILAAVLVRSIMVPINGLVAMLKEVAEGEGDLTKRLVLHSKCELGAMAEYFNLAWDKLDRMIAQVVEQSTLVGTYSGQLLIESSRIVKNSRQIASRAVSVATSSEEMSATASDIARNCAMAADNSHETSEVAAGGQVAVQKTVDRMNLLKAEMETSSKLIDRLGDSSQKIGEVASTIRDIADQTNLLALNAAIEAARAGEQGRGFAVVADEVRALAERTSRATSEIGEMIKSIQTETLEAVSAMKRSAEQVDAGVAEANASGEALGLIMDRIGEVTMQVSQISTAAEEQTATTGEMVTTIEGISDAVGSFDHTSRNINDKIQQLQFIADELKKSTSIFKTDVSQLLMLDTAKYDHVMFVNRIERCLDGKERIEATALPDHTCCRFGKWYFGEGKDICGSAPSFKVINGPHEMIHRLAKESIALFNGGDSVPAEEKLSQVENLSAEIVGLLEMVKDECRVRAV